MKQKISYLDARWQAVEIVETLEPYCNRIEIAGSVRRQKEEVGDIEILAIPKPTLDMFAMITETHKLDELDFEDIGLGKKIKGGHKYKQIELNSGVNLDLFIITPPAQWGIQFVIRTGPADFSKRVVTSKKYGGYLPSNLHVKDGAIWKGKNIIPTPEERDVFELLGMEYIDPKDRQ